MRDRGADGTHERPLSAEPEAEDRTVECPSCGAEVLLRPASHGVNDATAGLACPSCGTIVVSEPR